MMVCREEMEVPMSDEVKKSEVIDLGKIKCGFIIGLNDGEGEDIHFNVIGENPQEADLLGLHKIAGQRIQIITDLNNETGTTALIQTVAQLMQLTNQFGAILNQHTKALEKLMQGNQVMLAGMQALMGDKLKEVKTVEPKVIEVTETNEQPPQSDE